jgi:hypothetical protein
MAEDSADRISGQRPGNKVHTWWHSHRHLHPRQHRTLEEQCWSNAENCAAAPMPMMRWTAPGHHYLRGPSRV